MKLGWRTPQLNMFVPCNTARLLECLRMKPGLPPTRVVIWACWYGSMIIYGSADKDNAPSFVRVLYLPYHILSYWTAADRLRGHVTQVHL